MGKNKGIWIAIAVIILLGAGVTLFTNSFVKKNETSAPQVAAAASQERGPEDTPAAEEGAGGGLAMGAPVPGMYSAAAGGAEPETAAETAVLPPVDDGAAVMAADAGEDAAPVYDSAKENVAVSESPAVVLSPLAPANSRSKITAGKEENTDAKTYYEKRLAELDAQIQKIRSEPSDSTTYSMQILADKELKIWNLELNSVYASVLEGLADDARQALEDSQQVWTKERDNKASEAARKYSGGTLEGVEYTASLAESTRQRTYDLVNEYVSVLSSDN